MKSNLSVRNLLMGVVIVIVLAVVILRGDQLVDLIDTMKTGTRLFLFVAVLTQLGKYFLQSLAYTQTFEAVGEKYSIRHTLPLVFGTFFMNTVAPSANLAGITLIVDDARRRGIDPGKAGSAALLMQITIDSGFGVIILIGFSVLAFTVGLPLGWFLLGLLDFLVVSIMLSVLFLGRNHLSLLKKIMAKVERLVNKIIVKLKKNPLDPWADRTAESFADASVLITSNPAPTVRAFVCSVGASTCELACFVFVGMSFGVFNVQSLVCGYVVATLFAMFSVTPQGVGFVEAAIVLAFTAFGESSAAGMAIGLVYRGIVFWLPFLIGAVLIQTTSTFKGQKQEIGKVAAEEVRAELAPAVEGFSKQTEMFDATLMRAREERLKMEEAQKLSPKIASDKRKRIAAPRFMQSSKKRYKRKDTEEDLTAEDLSKCLNKDEHDE